MWNNKHGRTTGKWLDELSLACARPCTSAQQHVLCKGSEALWARNAKINLTSRIHQSSLQGKNNLKKCLSEYSNSAMTLKKKKKNPHGQESPNVSKCSQKTTRIEGTKWMHTWECGISSTLAKPWAEQHLPMPVSLSPQGWPQVKTAGRRELGKLDLLSPSFLQRYACCSSRPVQERQPLRSHFSRMKRGCFDWKTAHQ